MLMAIMVFIGLLETLPSNGRTKNKGIVCLAVQIWNLKHGFGMLPLGCVRMQLSNGRQDQWSPTLMCGHGLKSGGQGRRLNNQEETWLACQVMNMTGCWFIWRRSISGESTWLERWNQLNQSQNKKKKTIVKDASCVGIKFKGVYKRMGHTKCIRYWKSTNEEWGIQNASWSLRMKYR